MVDDDSRTGWENEKFYIDPVTGKVTIRVWVYNDLTINAIEDASGNSVIDTVNIAATDYAVLRVVHYSPVTIGGSLPAGTNNIGDVDVLTLPDVDVNDISKGTQTNDVKITLDGEDVTLTSLPTGTNRIGDSTPTLGVGGAKDLSYKLTLVANTATQIPETANVPSYDYVLVIANRSDTVMVWGVDTGIVSAGAIVKGVPLIAESGAVSIKLSASEYLHVACSGAKDVDYAILSVERS